MIEVIVNRPSFEYDIHSLVKSFFPREDVQIHVQDTFTEDTALRISVEFTDETVSICLMEQGEEGSWDDFCLYRTAFLLDQGKDTLRVWYGGKRKSDAAWGIGYTEGQYSVICTALEK